jgi:hypothetical protein
VLSNALFAACIRRAAGILGGYEALGEQLGIPPPLLEHWASGRGSADEATFLRVVDIVLERRFIPTRSSPAAWTRYRR